MLNNMMNIVLATDDNFVQHCGTTIKSITVNNCCVKFYLLTEGLAAQNIKLLQEVATENECNLEIRLVPSDIVKYFPMSKMASSHISIATYYRLFVTSLLPIEVEKAIYLDCDMIIRGSLEGLWNTNLENSPLAAVYQQNEWADSNDSWRRLGIPREYGYFNAGCLVLNLKFLRKDNFQQKAIDYINSSFDKIISHDQDVLNALYFDKVIPLKCKWNYLPIFWQSSFKKVEFPQKCYYFKEKKEMGFEPIVIHYVSKPKPWNYGCNNPYTSEYFKYLKLTPWKNYTVSFSFKEYYVFKVLPGIKRIIHKIDMINMVEYLKKRRIRRNTL